MKKNYYFIIAIVLLTSCLKDEDLKLQNHIYQPEELNDGWLIDTVSDNNVNINLFNEILSTAYSEDEAHFLKSLLIIHENKLLIEIYPQDLSDRNEPHQVWSVTKSLVSLLTGIAIDKSYIESEYDNIFKYLPEYIQYVSDDYLSISIEHCLTMRSGINYSNEGTEEEELLAQIPDDLTKYILQRPLYATPGTETFYKNSDPQLLVKVISNATNSDFVSFANDQLFKPLGINNYFWSRNKDNTPYGGFGLWLTPRDLAKVGLLMLNEGLWEDKQIVSQQWISKAISPKTQALLGYDYGYLIWTDAENNRFWFWGHGGQFVFVIPNKKLVIVLTSEQFANEGTTIQEAYPIIEKIILAIK